MRRPTRCAVLAVAGVCALSALTACATLSVPEEEKLGADAARELGRELDFVRDPWVVDYVEQIGRDLLVAAGPQPYAFRFYVVDDDTLNAFALPAGYVYIHTGVILEAANVSELAGVMAHEVGHVALRHVAENYNRQRTTGVLYQLGALAAAIFVGGNAAAGGQILGQLAAVAYLNTFSREAEAEADAFAVRVLPRAGYDPHGLVSFFETLRAQGQPQVPGFLSSHPATEERIESARALIAREDLPPDLRVRDDGRLEIIQRRIELLTGRARRRGPGRAAAAFPTRLYSRDVPPRPHALETRCPTLPPRPRPSEPCAPPATRRGPSARRSGRTSWTACARASGSSRVCWDTTRPSCPRSRTPCSADTT